MPDTDWIAFEKMSALRPDGTRCEVVVRVGRPLEDDPRTGTCVCLAQCSGGGDTDDDDDEPLRIYGQGSLQALHLALAALHLNLECLETSGLRFVWPENGAPLDWRRMWGLGLFGREPG